MSNTHTYTVATMAIPAAMHRAILRRLQEADYVHAIGDDGLLDMAGIGLEACTTTNDWWRGDTAWHPATIEACLERIEEMREEWAVVAKLLGFDTYADPEQIIGAVRALKADARETTIGRLQLRQGQIQQLADFAGVPVDGTAEEDQDVLQLTLGHTGHSGPGLYASFDDVPEGGAIFLGIPEGDPQLLFGTDLPHPANGEQRRWFMAGANAMAKGLALVNHGDSESQYVADLDDDSCALQVARQFTSENEPRKRAELQVAIISAMKLARAMANKAPLHAQLLKLIGATSHEEAAGLIGHWRGSALSAIRRAESLERRLTDAMRLAWMLVDAAGGSVTIKWEGWGKVDWSTAHIHREEDPESRAVTLKAKA